MEIVVKVLVLIPFFATPFSGLSGSLDNMVNFKCRTCLNPPVKIMTMKKLSLIMLIMRLLVSSAIMMTC